MFEINYFIDFIYPLVAINKDLPHSAYQWVLIGLISDFHSNHLKISVRYLSIYRFSRPPVFLSPKLAKIYTVFLSPFGFDQYSKPLMPKNRKLMYLWDFALIAKILFAFKRYFWKQRKRDKLLGRRKISAFQFFGPFFFWLLQFFLSYRMLAKNFYQF